MRAAKFQKSMSLFEWKWKLNLFLLKYILHLRLVQKEVLDIPFCLSIWTPSLPLQKCLDPFLPAKRNVWLHATVWKGDNYPGNRRWKDKCMGNFYRVKENEKKGRVRGKRRRKGKQNGKWKKKKVMREKWKKRKGGGETIKKDFEWSACLTCYNRPKVKMSFVGKMYNSCIQLL